MIKVTFKGVDITDDVSINRCYHDMYAEKKSDTLNIRFNDTDNLWDSWGPKVGDEITVAYGAIGTGKMYVQDVTPENGLYTLFAISAPPTWKEAKNKAWQKVKLLQMGAEVAKNHGLSFASYGVTDRLYDYILQSNENDYAFLSKRCALEGCAFLIYAGKLVMYSESYMEAISPTETITVSVDGDYKYTDNTACMFGACNIEKGNFKGSFEAGNDMARVYVPDWDINIGNEAEATRYAKNMLRYVNKDTLNGYVRSEIMAGYAAASMARLANARCPSWDGSVFLTHVRNDYANGQSKLFFRKPLQGY